MVRAAASSPSTRSSRAATAPAPGRRGGAGGAGDAVGLRRRRAAWGALGRRRQPHPRRRRRLDGRHGEAAQLAAPVQGDEDRPEEAVPLGGLAARLEDRHRASP